MTGFVVKRFYLLKYMFLYGLLPYCKDTFELNFDSNQEVLKV